MPTKQMKKVEPFPPHPLRRTERKSPAFNPRELILPSSSGQHVTTAPRDPRDTCCYGGHVFLDAVKAMMSRMLLMLHSVLTVWRVTMLHGPSFWALIVVPIGLIVEVLIILLERKGKDWKRFSPCILIYLFSVLPGVWILNLDSYYSDEPQEDQGNETSHAEVYAESPVMFSSSISASDWKVLLEQSMLLLIIISRWLMPKGSLTREQLSGLLLGYVGTASDTMDFAALLSEDKFELSFTYVILAVYSLSLCQFIFIKTVVDEDEEEEEELDEEEDKDEAEPTKKPVSFKQLWRMFIERVLKTEVWAIFVTVFMQDGPFFMVRVAAIIKYGIASQTHFFFTAKNAILLFLESYRLHAIYKEYKDSEIVAKENRRKMWRQFYKNVSYMSAFSVNFKGKQSIAAQDIELGDKK